MRFNSDYLVGSWSRHSRDLEHPPWHVERAMNQLAREDEHRSLDVRHWPPEALDRLSAELAACDFSGPDARLFTRLSVASYIDQVVRPTSADPSLVKMVERLRAARMSGTKQFNPGTGRMITMWDDKAELARLCPDDSREESDRMSRRYLPMMVRWSGNGTKMRQRWRTVQSCVFAPRNYPAGQLDAGQRDCWSSFVKTIIHPSKALLRQYPTLRSIKGALCTMESPLSANHDWNVHLNVILLCDGYLDWTELQAAWGSSLFVREVKGTEEEVAGALRELIKYAVRAVPEKSAEHAARHSTDAPAMIHWPPALWLEWWAAGLGKRRTRSYGVLHHLPKEEPEPLEGFVTVARVWAEAGRYRMHSQVSLFLIQGHNSNPGNLGFGADQHLRAPPDDD